MEMTFDLVLSFLMLVTCAWCWLIHNRLRKLRCDRSEISEFIGTLTTATSSAEAAIKGLRTVGNDAERKLLRQKDNLQRQVDELNRLLELAQKVARKLDQSVRQSNKRQISTTKEKSMSMSNTEDCSLGEGRNARGAVASVSVGRKQGERGSGYDVTSEKNTDDIPSGRTALMQALQALQ
jgi:hypothetical protein